MIDLFITEINNDSGKGYIASGLAATMQSLGYQSCIYKPIDIGTVEIKGFVQSADLVYAKNIDPYIKTASTYTFKETISPYITAETEGFRIDRNLIKKDFENLSKQIDCLVTMGTQGIMTPIDVNFLEVDLIKFLDLPVLIVIKPCPDAINQTLLTINQIEAKGSKVRGIILCDNEQYHNELKHLPRLIEEYSSARILGFMQDIDYSKCTASELITQILNGIDIESVFDVTIAKLNV